jgi:hypothetical protein
MEREDNITTNENPNFDLNLFQMGFSPNTQNERRDQREQGDQREQRDQREQGDQREQNTLAPMFDIDIKKSQEFKQPELSKEEQEKELKKLEQELKKAEAEDESFNQYYNSILYKLVAEQDEEFIKKKIKEVYNPFVLISNEIEDFFNTRFCVWFVVILVVVIWFLWYYGYFEDVKLESSNRPINKRYKHPMYCKPNNDFINDDDLDYAKLI